MIKPNFVHRIVRYMRDPVYLKLIPSTQGKNSFFEKNAFQWDEFRLLVDRIPVCTGRGCLPEGGVCPGGVSARGGVCPGGSAWGVCIPACNGADTPRGQTDTCENKTFTNFVCGR